VKSPLWIRFFRKVKTIANWLAEFKGSENKDIIFMAQESSGNASQRYLVIIKFTRFKRFYNNNTNGDDFKHKDVIHGVKVRVDI